MKEPIIGIDLGTTNSEVAIYDRGRVTVIPIPETNMKILPSVVAFNDNLLIGEPAKNQYILNPHQTVMSIKRKMGLTETIKLGENNYTPQEISAMILKKLKEVAEQHLGEKVSQAVITVPAYFSDEQRLATREAGELAGLKVARMINEPTAAAMAYKSQDKEHKLILVYDWGGGTFDVSIIALEEDVVEVIATHGNNHLGGDDFDSKIIDHITEHLQKDGIDLKDSLKAQARIRRAAEAAKITLSDHPYALIEEEYLIEHKKKPYHLSLELARHDYETMIKSFIDETLVCTHKALASADLVASDIDEIILVGGSTRTPIITERLAEEFKRETHSEIDPDLCVATGAAIQGAIIAGETIKSVLVDVTPYTFGTDCVGFRNGVPDLHIYKPIIKKNTPIPVTKSEVFYTLRDNQEKVQVSIYQGEDEDALNNIKIGEFMLEGLGDYPADSPIITQFKLDINGILHVTTTEKKTGLTKSITIHNAISNFGEHEMEQAKAKIDQLFSKPKEEVEIIEDSPNLQEKVDTIINQAEEILDKVSDEDREDIIELIEDIRDAMQEKNESVIEKQLEQLSDMLFYLGGKES